MCYQERIKLTVYTPFHHISFILVSPSCPIIIQPELPLHRGNEELHTFEEIKLSSQGNELLKTMRWKGAHGLRASVVLCLLHRPGYKLWDDSSAVRSMFLTTEGGKTRVPTHLPSEDWDCTALFQATIFAWSFALPDSRGHHRTLSDLRVSQGGGGSLFPCSLPKLPYVPMFPHSLRMFS